MSRTRSTYLVPVFCSWVFSALTLCGFTIVVEPQAKLTKRIGLLVDRSGSMSGFNLQRAWSVVAEIAAQPVDEMELAVWAFSDDVRRWPGVKKEGAEAPDGWAALPSAEAVTSAQKWLEDQGSGNNTPVIPALREIFRERRTELSLVIITDGHFDEQDQLVIAALAECQVQRQKAKLDPIVVMLYGIGSSPHRNAMNMLGSLGRGGFLIDDVPEEPSAPPTPHK